MTPRRAIEVATPLPLPQQKLTAAPIVANVLGGFRALTLRRLERGGDVMAEGIYSSGLQGGKAQVTREGTLGDAIEGLDPLLKQVSQHRNALEQFLGRLIGPHPTPVNDGGVDGPSPPSRIAQLNLRVRALAAELERIDQLVRQIDLAL